MIRWLAPIAARANQSFRTGFELFVFEPAKGYVKALKKSTSLVSTMREVFECCTYRRNGQFDDAHVAGHPGPLCLVAEPAYWQGVGQECGRIGQISHDGREQEHPDIDPQDDARDATLLF